MKVTIPQLAESLEARIRLIPNQAHTAELKQADPVELVEIACAYIVAGLQKESSFVNLIADIGTRVRDKLGHKRNSVKAAHLGAFILETFEDNSLFARELKTNGKNQAYFVISDDEDTLSDLWTLIKPENAEFSPNLEPLDDWAGGIHKNGLPLVRHAPKSLLRQLNPVKHDIIFNAVNKAQNTGWLINPDVLKVFVACSNTAEKAIHEGSYAFSYLDPDEQREQKSSKKREVKIIKKMAKTIGQNSFYHQYNLDFRGRIYPTTAYLHEQSSDNAKGLLLLEKGEALGTNGLKWLNIHATNCWGEDKLSLLDRELFAEVHKDEWISYAQDPVNNKGWIKADKPWSFLAACFEFMFIQNEILDGDIESVEEFVSHLPVFIDGTNNGVQWLTALSKDDSVAPLVNLVPTEQPGDVYQFIANKVWAGVKNDYNPSNEPEYQVFMDGLKVINDEFKDLADRRSTAVKAALKEDKDDILQSFKIERDKLVEKSKHYRIPYTKDVLGTMSANYWNEVTDHKTQRKIAKRPVMTLGYGGTRFGFSEMVMEDTKKLGSHFRNMQMKWASYLGGKIYDICMGENGYTAALPGPARMLKLFETLAERSVDRQEKLGWTVPITNFPVIQQYTSAATSVINIKYLGKRLQLTIRVMEEKSIKRSKQKAAAAPNVVHSFDAAHLAMTVTSCEFQTPTVHDSFGSHAGNMESMFTAVREKFVEFNSVDPLQKLLEEQEATELMPQRGILDVNDVLKSDFAFS